jgi:hypothetical protein
MNIEELFLDLSERMVAANVGAQRKQSSRRNVVVVEQETSSAPQSKIGCCG